MTNSVCAWIDSILTSLAGQKLLEGGQLGLSGRVAILKVTWIEDNSTKSVYKDVRESESDENGAASSKGARGD